MTRILTIDIETTRAVVETFSLFTRYIHIDRIIMPSRILCFAATWRGDDRIIFHPAWDDNDDDAYRRMIEAAWNLLNSADVVCTYNGDRFDRQWLNAEFQRLEMPPPMPYKSLDLIKVSKQQFRQGLLSLKLDWSSRHFLGDRKVPHGARDLWDDIRRGTKRQKRDAQRLMRQYCEHDTRLTARLMERFLPWANNINLALDCSDDGLLRCTKCGSENLKRDGVKQYRTISGLYQMWRCRDCGATSRGHRRKQTTELRPV